MDQEDHTLRARADRIWDWVDRTVIRPGKAVPIGADDPCTLDPKALQPLTEHQSATAPVIWLLGKVQAGKSSIVRALTGDTDAAVGAGFRPCTRSARIYDLPPEAPILRFLDSRGLGEVGYDPSEDLHVNAGESHLIMPVFRASDPAQKPVFDALTTIRRQRPDWPILGVVTCLHETYPPGAGHPAPYPFGQDAEPTGPVPTDLARAVAHHRAALNSLPGNGAVGLVAVDFTQELHGLNPLDYGREALAAALAETAPPAIAGALAAREGDAVTARATSHVLGYASAAAAADLIPLASTVAVPAVWGKMLHSLAQIHDVEWTRNHLAQFAGCLGGAVLVKETAKHGLKNAAKLVPVVGWTLGTAGSAALTFASSYAIGIAACRYLSYLSRGEPVSEDAVKTAFEEALSRGRKEAEDRDLGGDER